MPLYEYRCQQCDRSFELLRPMSEDDSGVRCPHCGSEKIERELSAFASFSPGGSPGAAPSSGSGCGHRFG